MPELSTKYLRRLNRGGRAVWVPERLRRYVGCFGCDEGEGTVVVVGLGDRFYGPRCVERLGLKPVEVNHQGTKDTKGRERHEQD